MLSLRNVSAAWRKGRRDTERRFSVCWRVYVQLSVCVCAIEKAGTGGHGEEIGGSHMLPSSWLLSK